MARFARKDSERGQTPRGSSGSCVVRVHDGDDGVVGAAPRAHEHVLQMEKPMAEPGAFAAGRIAGQAHDGVPQLGEAFRQILFMRAAASRAPVRASGRKPPGSGQPPGTVLKSSASRCDVRVSSIWVSVDCKTGWRRYRRKWLPRAPPDDRPCRAAPGLSVPRRAVGQVRAETVPTFPVCCCHAAPVMADRASRSNPSRAPGGHESQHGGLGCSSRPAAQRRKFAEAGRGTATTVRTPRARYRGTCDLR